MRNGRYNNNNNNNPHIHSKFHAFKNGEGGKVSWQLWKISICNNIPFIASLPLKNLQLSRMGDSQVSVGLKKCVHLGFCLRRLFSLLTNMTPLKTWGCSLCSFTPCPAMKDRIQDGEWHCSWYHQLLGFLSANLWQQIMFWKWFFDVFLLRAWGL